MQLKTIFNRVTKYNPFVVAHVELTEDAWQQPTIEITMRETALYHNLGNLPEPIFTHKFF